MSAAKRKAKSPAWKNPRDMMKRHLKRKSNRCLMSEAVVACSSTSDADTNTTSEPPLKFGHLSNRSTNPFKHFSPVKRIKIADEKENDEVPSWETDNALLEFPSGLFNRIEKNEKLCDNERRFVGFQTPDSLLPIDFSSLSSCCIPSKDVRSCIADLSDHRVSKTLPIDLRLGTKLRIESLKPFPWMRIEDPPGNYHVRVTGLETDMGIQLFLPNGGDFSKHDGRTFINAEVHLIARLEASTLYWQFPNIPWMTTFPRLDAARKFSGIKKEKMPSLNSFGEAAIESLNAQWISAFNHLFFSWKKGARRHFYLCCSAFTILFSKTAKENTEMDDASCSRSSWTNNSVLSVIISPTTSGFRQQLREEGINFELPLRQNSRRSSHEHNGIYFGLDNEDSVYNDVTQSSVLSVTTQNKSFLTATISSENLKSSDERIKEVDIGSDGDHDVSEDSDHEAWLQDIGVSPKSTRLLTRNISLSSFNEKSLLDSAMADVSQHSVTNVSSPSDISKSVILISEPGSIQALFSFLNESKVCHPRTGLYAGLPPTLLSSEPFLHGSLKNLNKFSQIIKLDDGESKYVCEFSNGPIMPHMLSQLTNFFAACSSLNTSDNRIKVHVYGRHFCAAMNQASNIEGVVDYTSFEYAVNEGLYYLI